MAGFDAMASAFNQNRQVARSNLEVSLQKENFGGKIAYQSPLPNPQKWESCALGMTPFFFIGTRYDPFF